MTLAHPNPRQDTHAFDIAADGRLSGGSVFHKVEPGYCYGLKVDEDGTVWSSAADGVQCLSPEGRLLGVVHVPARVSNIAWGGGPFRNRMFIAAAKRVFASFLNRRGASVPGNGL